MVVTAWYLWTQFMGVLGIMVGVVYLWDEIIIPLWRRHTRKGGMIRWYDEEYDENGNPL